MKHKINYDVKKSVVAEARNVQSVRRLNVDWLAGAMEGRWGRGGQADGGQSEGGRASGRLVGRPIGLTHTQQQCQTEDCKLFHAVRQSTIGFSR